VVFRRALVAVPAGSIARVPATTTP